MKLTRSAFAIAFATASSASAQFQVTFPAVRGQFNQHNETQFCDGYTKPANRSRFPVTSGFIVWETPNPSWTVGVMLSTAPSPTSFSDFRTASGADQLVVDYFQGNGTMGCIHLVPTAAGIPGVQNGTDLTFQVVFDDRSGGTLYQCMDVTLDDQYRIPVDIECTNPQGQPPSNSTSGLSSSITVGFPSPARSGSPTSTQGGTPSAASTGLSSSVAALAVVNRLLQLISAGVLAALLV